MGRLVWYTAHAAGCAWECGSRRPKGGDHRSETRTLPPFFLSNKPVDHRWSGFIETTLPLWHVRAALLGGYYVMRAGATYPCHPHYDSKTPGDAWPGGCFGDWNGTAAVAQTLKSIRTSPAISPGAPRQALQLDASSGPGGYAALRTRGSHAAVVVLNVASHPANISIELTGTAVARCEGGIDFLPFQRNHVWQTLNC